MNNIELNNIELIKRSEIMGFLGEVCYIQLLHIIGDTKATNIWVKNHGMNSRALSKDVLDISSYKYVINDNLKEAIFIHLSRNSIYHQLPETFFHPLVITSLTMSHVEVVESIKKNKKIENDNIHFFIPFDTKLFEKKVRLVKRYINIFDDETSTKLLFNLAKIIISKDIPISKEQYYKLFLKICDAEKLKENLPLLENLLEQILGYKVQLNYVKHMHIVSPFKTIGKAILGYSFGLQGETKGEFDDISAIMIVDKEMDYNSIEEHKTIIRMILEYFVFSNRQILVKFQTNKNADVVLGENYLGYNTVLKAS